MSTLLRHCLLAGMTTCALAAGSLPFLASPISSSQIQGATIAFDRGLQRYEQLLRVQLAGTAASENGNMEPGSATPMSPAPLKTTGARDSRNTMDKRSPSHPAPADDLDTTGTPAIDDPSVATDAIPRDAYE